MNPYENKSLKTEGIKLLLLLLFPLLFSLQSYASLIKGDRRTALSFGENGEYLDAEQYAKDNPDVLEAYGMNPSAFWSHYLHFGIKEGRRAYGLDASSPEAVAKLKVFTVAEQICNDAMSDREKVKAVHDWIIQQTKYDIENQRRRTIPEDSYHIEGVMLKGVAVCNGYVEAFDYFMEVLGIPHEVVVGKSVGRGGAVGSHAWNRVWIDGKWLSVDCTWDDPVTEDGENQIIDKYFLRTEEEIAGNHITEKIFKNYQNRKVKS